MEDKKLLLDPNLSQFSPVHYKCCKTILLSSILISMCNIFNLFYLTTICFAATIFGEKNVKQYGGSQITIINPAHFPDPYIVTEFLEPMVMGTIITPGWCSHDCSIAYTQPLTLNEYTYTFMYK